MTGSRIERLIENGAVASYADAARQLGVTRARMSQVLNLLSLPPQVQEGSSSATCTSASGG